MTADAKILLLLLVLLGTAACEPTARAPGAEVGDGQTGSPPLTPDGWGPLHVGMQRADLVTAIGGPADPSAVGGPEPEACEEFPPERAPAGLFVMLEQRRLTRITLREGSSIRTGDGLAVGDRADEVERAVGAAALVTPHKYLPAPARYVTVWASPPDSPAPRGIVYEIGTDGRIDRIHAGGPSIQYVEGCL